MPRYYPQKDLDPIEKFNRELIGEPNLSKDGIIDQFVILYRVSVYETERLEDNKNLQARFGKTMEPIVIFVSALGTTRTHSSLILANYACV